MISCDQKEDFYYAIEKTNEKGLKIALNPSPINDELLKYPISLVDILILNEIEAKALIGKETLENNTILSELNELFPNAEIVLTVGEKGSFYVSKKAMFSQSIFKVKVVDTTATGDTFFGFFIDSYVKGVSPKKALETASKAAAIAVS